jgi:apolipoprotein D and lipocalin family protein
MFNYSFKKSIVLSLFIFTSTISMSQNLQTVLSVDLEKYMGKWYEIASFPQRFQKGCHGTTAEYTLNDKGSVTIENKCFKDSVDGKVSSIKGKAFVVENSGNSKFNIQFFWPFKGKYWIIDLADDYSYAVVSHPTKKYLWILSRNPFMDDTTYLSIITKLKDKGFDVTKIRITHQF